MGLLLMFANQGCKIVFNKTSVTVYLPNGHPILNGWWDIDGPQLWQFPLTAPPPPPAHSPPLAPIAGGLSVAMSAGLPHPSMLTRTTDTIKHPTKGYNMKWCKLFGPGRSKVTPPGMYMHAPHDHAKWLLSKMESLAKFNAKKKFLKANKSKASDDNNSTNNNTKCLKLSDSIINGLTTEIMIGDSKACKMAKRWFENANKGTSNQADSLVKD
jgi:hypothetical protein